MTDGTVVVVGLGMTGTVTLLRAVSGHLYEHEVCRVHVGSHAVVFADARKFGNALMFSSSEEAHQHLDSRIGVDAYSALTAVQLRDIVGIGSAQIKSALLDQSRLAGIGNYLADEILHHARLLPTRACASLTDQDWVALNKARVVIIERALEAGGMSMRDYVDTAGREGRMTEQLRVYGRRDRPCGTCGEPVAHTKVAGRTSWHCRSCQR
jgi:formamidopyrimidine-DNA glycosylase